MDNMALNREISDIFNYLDKTFLKLKRNNIKRELLNFHLF